MFAPLLSREIRNASCVIAKIKNKRLRIWILGLLRIYVASVVYKGGFWTTAEVNCCKYWIHEQTGTCGFDRYLLQTHRREGIIFKETIHYLEPGINICVIYCSYLCGVNKQRRGERWNKWRTVSRFFFSSSFLCVLLAN